MSHFEVKQGNFYVNRVCTANFLMNFSTDSPPGLHLQVRFTADWRLLEATNKRAPARFKAQNTRRRAPAEGTVYSGGFAMIRDFIELGADMSLWSRRRFFLTSIAGTAAAASTGNLFGRSKGGE